MIERSGLLHVAGSGRFPTPTRFFVGRLEDASLISWIGNSHTGQLTAVLTAAGIEAAKPRPARKAKAVTTFASQLSAVFRQPSKAKK